MRAMTLSDFIAGKLETSSLRIEERRTGVSRGSLDKIAKKQLKGPPDLETLVKLADCYKISLWRMIEMAGEDLDLPNGIDTELARLTAEIPDLRRSLVLLADLPEERRKACVGYLLSMVHHEAGRSAA